MKNHSSKLAVLIALVPLVFVQACSTAGKSIGAGAGMGALLGGGVGALADPGRGGGNRFRNILIGTGVGGAVGAGTGYIAHRLAQDDREESYKKGKDETKKEITDQAMAGSGSAPSLVPPKTESFWVPDQIRGQTFIPGHFEFRIIEGAHWEVNR